MVGERGSVHATCVASEGLGLLLRGPSGAGKSDLALRLIDGGAELVADDQVLLERRGDQVVASAPAALLGLIEMRGFGPVLMPCRPEVALGLVVDLVARQAVERVPEPARIRLCGVALPHLRLHAFDAATPAKLRLCARMARDGRLMPVSHVSFVARSLVDGPLVDHASVDRS